MANVNLLNSQVERHSKERPLSSAGAIISLVVLLVIVAVSFALILVNRNLSKKINLTKSDYEERSAKLIEGRNLDIIDLQLRINKLQEVSKQRNSVLDSMQNVEKYLVSGVVVKDYKYDKKGHILKLACMATDYDVVAKQVASFKSLDYFSDVILESTKTLGAGGVEFSISIIEEETE